MASKVDNENHSALSLAIEEEKYYCAKILIFRNTDVNAGGGLLNSTVSIGIVKV